MGNGMNGKGGRLEETGSDMVVTDLERAVISDDERDRKVAAEMDLTIDRDVVGGVETCE